MIEDAKRKKHVEWDDWLFYFSFNIPRPKQHGLHFADDVFKWIYWKEKCILIKFLFLQAKLKLNQIVFGNSFSSNNKHAIT